MAEAKLENVFKDCTPEVGKPCELLIDLAKIHLFDATTEVAL